MRRLLVIAVLALSACGGGGNDDHAYRLMDATWDHLRPEDRTWFCAMSESGRIDAMTEMGFDEVQGQAERLDQLCLIEAYKNG